MSFPAKLLNPGEHVVVSTRTHVKVLLVPALVLLVIAFATALLGTLVNRQLDDTAATTVGVVVGALAAAALVWFVLRPFVLWWTTTYTFTNRRFVKRSGLIAKEGRTIPLNRISGVDFEIGILDRLLGCGTLVVSDASEQGRVELSDIPDVERVQQIVAEQLHQLSGREPRMSDDGT